jgi:hypothetical protein
MTVQNFVCEHLHQPLFDAWMPMQLATGNLPFAYDQRDKYTSVYWQGRRWQWVDPFKEVQAAIAANEARLKSKTRIISEGGDDIEDVFDEIASEEALAQEKGVALPTPDSGGGGTNTPNDEGGSDADGGRARPAIVVNVPDAQKAVNDLRSDAFRKINGFSQELACQKESTLRIENSVSSMSSVLEKIEARLETFTGAPSAHAEVSVSIVEKTSEPETPQAADAPQVKNGPSDCAQTSPESATDDLSSSDTPSQEKNSPTGDAAATAAHQKSSEGQASKRAGRKAADATPDA